MVKMKRMAMGRRADLILRKGSAEYGCAEAGAKDEGLWGTKKLLEKGVKAAKALKDMLNQLSDLVGNDESSVRQLCTIGYILSGIVMDSNLCIKKDALIIIYNRNVSRGDDYGFTDRILLQNNKVAVVLYSHWCFSGEK